MLVNRRRHIRFRQLLSLSLEYFIWKNKNISVAKRFHSHFSSYDFIRCHLSLIQCKALNSKSAANEVLLKKNPQNDICSVEDVNEIQSSQPGYNSLQVRLHQNRHEKKSPPSKFRCRLIGNPSADSTE